MKRAISFIVAISLVFAVSFVSAEIFGTISTKAVSEYVVPSGSLIYDDTVQQNDIFILLPSGIYLDFWNSTPWNGEDNFGKENDYSLGWSGNLGNTGINADIGISYFDIIDLFESDGDIINPYLKLSKEIAATENHSLIPYLKMEFPTPVKGSTPKSGIYTQVGIDHSWQVFKKVSVNQNAYILYDNGAYGLDNGFVGIYSPSAAIQITNNLALDYLFFIYTPITSLLDKRKIETVHSIGLTYNFDLLK